MARKTWEVEPREGGRWAVQRTGTQRADSLHDKKSSAIARGQELAKGAPLGQLRIKGGDGRIEREGTYGEDPRGKQG